MAYGYYWSGNSETNASFNLITLYVSATRFVNYISVLLFSFENTVIVSHPFKYCREAMIGLKQLVVRATMCSKKTGNYSDAMLSMINYVNYGQLDTMVNNTLCQLWSTRKISWIQHATNACFESWQKSWDTRTTNFDGRHRRYHMAHGITRVQHVMVLVAAFANVDLLLVKLGVHPNPKR